MRKLIAAFALFFAVSLFGSNGKVLANKLGLSASSKASTLWNRVFKKARKMKKYGIDKLSADKKQVLKTYLIEHAADSDAPEVAGI